MLVAWLVKVTVAPGTTAPDASVTVPLAWPPRVCEKTGRQDARQKIIDSKVDFFAKCIRSSTLSCRSVENCWVTDLSDTLQRPRPIASFHGQIQDKKYIF